MARPGPLDQVAPIPASDDLLPAPAGVDLWCFFYEEHLPPETDNELAAAYQALLTADERARHQRYYFDRDRRLFLATRALERTVLSRYAAVAPAAWRFERTEHGRPFVAGPERPAIHFNLTNTPGLVACAVSRVERVGVDAENMTRTGETTAIADRFFSSAEVEALRALPETAQRERFFCYWTLKESYIKARGLGLAIPLAQFSFELDRGEGIGIGFDERLEDDPAPWRFDLFRASERHMLAVGAALGGRAPREPASLVRYRSCVPLRGDA